MLEAWQTHLALHEKLSLLGELLPEDSPSAEAAFSLQLLHLGPESLLLLLRGRSPNFF